MGTVYSREDMVRDSIQRLVTLPDRPGMAAQVLWRDNDKDGFYTSHLVTGLGRYREPGMSDPPAGRVMTPPPRLQTA
jgi:hypothetical protein